MEITKSWTQKIELEAKQCRKELIKLIEKEVGEDVPVLFPLKHEDNIGEAWRTYYDEGIHDWRIAGVKVKGFELYIQYDSDDSWLIDSFVQYPYDIFQLYDVTLQKIELVQEHRGFPRYHLLTSRNEDMEFPVSWGGTDNPNVAIIKDYEGVLVSYSNKEYRVNIDCVDKMLIVNSVNCYTTAQSDSILLFTDQDVFDRFCLSCPNYQGEARMITEQDKKDLDY